MAIPFSGVPTPYRVQAAGRWWYANCAWDAFGICSALGVDGRIETSCPDCGDPIVVEVRGERPDDESLVFHCLVPAARAEPGDPRPPRPDGRVLASLLDDALARD
jgi:hypothetical protein